MPITDEDKATITALISEAITAAMPAVLDPIKKEFGRMANGAATTAATAAVKGLREKLEALPDAEGLATLIDAKIGEKVPAKVDPAKAGGEQMTIEKAVADATRAVEAKFQKQLDTVNTKLKAEADEKAEILTKQQRTEERTMLGKVLESAGVKSPTLRQGALALMIDRGVVARDADGNVVFKSKDKRGAEEVLSLEEGITAWVATDEGKEYLPAKDSGGSGDPKGGKGGNNGGKVPDGWVDPRAAMAVLNRRG